MQKAALADKEKIRAEMSKITFEHGRNLSKLRGTLRLFRKVGLDVKATQIEQKIERARLEFRQKMDDLKDRRRKLDDELRMAQEIQKKADEARAKILRLQ